MKNSQIPSINAQDPDKIIKQIENINAEIRHKENGLNEKEQAQLRNDLVYVIHETGIKFPEEKEQELEHLKDKIRKDQPTQQILDSLKTFKNKIEPRVI